jgi:sulfate adenylyltransferase subunit 2
MSLMTGEALRQALDSGGFDIILSEVRRDEANCQTEERVFSLRSPEHRMDPRLQQPELWNLYSGRLRTGETIRVSPLLNWTEEDIWEYIGQEDVPIADLYRAAPRPVVQRSGEWIMVDDNRFPLEVGEIPEIRMVRFRTLGCYPLTAAFESRATTVSEILTEIRKSQGARRHRRLIDYHPQQP